MRKYPATLNRLVNYKARELSFSAIALTEILGTLNRGAGRPANREQVRVAAAKFPVVNFDSKAAACTAVLFAKHDIKGNRAPGIR